MESEDVAFTIGIYVNSRGFAAVLMKRIMRLVPRTGVKERAVMRRGELIEIPQLKPIKYSYYPSRGFGFREMGEGIEGLIGECTSTPMAYVNDLPVMRDFIDAMGFNMVVEYLEVDPENLLLTINAMSSDKTLIYPNRQTEEGVITLDVINETRRMKDDETVESHLLNAIGLSLHGHEFGTPIWLEGLANLDDVEWEQ